MALKFATNQTLTSVTALPSSVPTDNLILISTQTASNSASISFTSGLDSTYDAYEFKFIDLHIRTAGHNFNFQGSTNGGSSYGVTMTTTLFNAVHPEDDSFTQFQYNTSNDLAQSTSYQTIGWYHSADADGCGVGSLQLYNPSSTTYVKHFISRYNLMDNNVGNRDVLMAGYFNTTSAINAINFSTSSGNFDGTIKLYGVKKS
jgi:hypothetical protein